jgi:hypothetical protein
VRNISAISGNSKYVFTIFIALQQQIFLDIKNEIDGWIIINRLKTKLLNEKKVTLKFAVL